MNLNALFEQQLSGRHFSFEVLPPLKGTGTDNLFQTVAMLMELDPLYINITTHHSEYVYTEKGGGLLERHRVRQFLGIEHLLLLRGDKAKDDSRFTATAGGHTHTTDLIRQVQQFNNGIFADGTRMKNPGKPFNFGVACYPEKHEEAPNLEQDMIFLKQKQELGAQYAITQMFFDNQKYYAFVKKAREMGITIPIIPGIKPLSKLSQLTVIPRTFHCDLPQALAAAMMECKNDEEAARLGIEWATRQCRDLYAHGIQNIHFYTTSAVNSVREVVRRLL